MSSSSYLPQLVSHPIFRRTDGGVASDVKCHRGRTSRLVQRKTELLVGVGKELRSCSLLDDGSIGSEGTAYRVLCNPALDFEIQQLVLNPTGKLLAVVGTHHLAVVVLPDSAGGVVKAASRHDGEAEAGPSRSLLVERIDCKGARIAPEIYNVGRHASPIADVKWHPWGTNGACLIVLTEDGVLREYDTSISTTEAQQSTSFLPISTNTSRSSSPPRRKSAFGIANTGAKTAVAFSFGALSSWSMMAASVHASDWSALTLFGLMANGDIYAICPYLPRNATIPQAYAQGLEVYLAGKTQRLKEHAAHGLSAPERMALSRRLAEQHKYARKILQQIESQDPPPQLGKMDLDVPANATTTNRLRNIASPVDLSSIQVQGPMLLQPEPAELEDSDDPRASDFAYIGAGAAGDLGVIAVVWTDGRVDMCIEAERVEAQWQPSLDDDAPALLVYESIDLGFSSEADHPRIACDPLHNGNICVVHSGGVHSISVSPWYDELLAAEDQAALMALWEGNVPSSIKVLLSARIDSAVIVADLQVPHGIIATTQSGAETLLLAESPTISPLLEADAVPHPFPSLLAQSPFDVQPRTFTDAVRKAQLGAAVPSDQARKPLTNVSPESLRALSHIFDRFSAAVRDISTTSSKVEARLDLQVEEIGRQMQKCQAISQKLEARQKEEDLKTRMQRALETQHDLSARLDKVAQRLMNQSHPELSQQEQAWIAELDRMQEALDYGSKSLKGRADVAASQLALLRPTLESIKLEQERRARGTSSSPFRPQTPSSPSLGHTQRSRIERALSEKTQTIASLLTELSTLQESLASLSVK